MALGELNTVRELLLYQNLIGYIKKFASDATYDYVGTSEPGASTSSAIWQIKRINMTTGDITWADGDSKFDNVWDNRTSLSYS